MADENTPTCYVIAGPNGAEKTTFALQHLPLATGCEDFINADLIAQGLAPLNSERAQFAAGRLFLGEIRKRVTRRNDFAFEATLAGRGHLRLLRELRRTGWRIVLFFLWIPDARFSQARVRERVAQGGVVGGRGCGTGRVLCA